MTIRVKLQADGTRQTFKELKSPLLPQFDHEGTLYLGLKELKPGQSLSILFQVSEATADTDVKRPTVLWSYLADNKWVDFKPFEIVGDTTGGLIASGIITFAIPREITLQNTLLPAGLVWLRAAVAENARGVSELIDARTQAVRATFVDQSNDPNHLASPLPKKKVAGLVSDDAAISMAIFFVLSRGVPHQIFEIEDRRFSFLIKDFDGNDLLRGVQSAIGEGCARKLLLDAARRGRRLDAYEVIDEENSFGFRLLDDDGEPLAEHPIRYGTQQQRDTARDACWQFLRDLSVKPYLIRDSYFFEVVDVNGRALLRSTKNWPSKRLAEEAFKQFANLAQDETNYRRSYNNCQCQYTFSVVDPRDDSTDMLKPDPIAVHPHTHKLPRPRDRQIKITLQLLRSQTLKYSTSGTPSGYYFRLKGGGDLVSTFRYTHRAAAEAACTSLFARLTDEAAYTIEQQDDGLHLVLSDASGSVRAQSEPGQHDALLAMRDAMIALAHQDTPLPYTIVKTIPSYRCRLADTDGHPLLESSHGRTIIAARIDGFTSADSRDEAMRATLALFQDTAQEPQPDVIEIDGEFYFVFRFSTTLSIQGFSAHATENSARAEATSFAVIARVDDNYRRRDDAAAGNYGFDILSADSDENPDWERDEKCEQCNRFVELSQKDQNFRRITADQWCQHGLELLGSDGQTLAKHPKLFDSAKERDEYIQAIQCLADTEGLHLVEHLLLRPRTIIFEVRHDESDETLFRSVSSFRNDDRAAHQLKSLLDRIVAAGEVVERFALPPKFGFRLVDAVGQAVAEPVELFDTEQQRDTAADALLLYVRDRFSDPASRETTALRRFAAAKEKLLPVGDGCRDEEGKLCPVRADNYSFRVTAVVPYWPQRFRTDEFRRFFERTIRTETPAHVFLRVCWVDVCQMRQFENAYRRWLEALADPETTDLASAQDALVEILFQLKNVYPPARLSQMILGQSILGTGADNVDNA